MTFEESKEDVNSQEAAEDAFKQSLAALLFAFKELVGDGRWMSVNGEVNGDKFCLAVGTEDLADKLHSLIVENFAE